MGFSEKQKYHLVPDILCGVLSAKEVPDVVVNKWLCVILMNDGKNANYNFLMYVYTHIYFCIQFNNSSTSRYNEQLEKTKIFYTSALLMPWEPLIPPHAIKLPLWKE